MTKTKRCPMCYGRKTINVWEEVARDETSVTCKRREKTCSICNGTGEVPVTNADRIRSMTDEELAEFLWDFNLADVSTGKIGEFGPHMFRYRLREWLQQPAE